MIESKLVFISRYDEYIDGILKSLKSDSRVCYMNLNKSHDYLSGIFKEKGFERDSFYFIDGITISIKKPQKCASCYYIKDLNNMDLIFSKIKTVVSAGYNVFVLDSLSNIFSQGVSIEESKKFLGEIVSLIEDNGGKIIVICNKEHEEVVADSGIIRFFNVYERPFSLFGLS